jgi:hypothetical protein
MSAPAPTCKLLAVADVDASTAVPLIDAAEISTFPLPAGNELGALTVRGWRLREGMPP